MIKKLFGYLLIITLLFAATPLLSFGQPIVDLIYESYSYVPPFYRGKTLNVNQGTVIVTALPVLIKANGEKVPDKSVIYTWKKDGLVQQSNSGAGKNTFTFKGSVPIKDAIIGVTASSPDGSLVVSNQVTVTNEDPKIIFYENSPIYGIMFNRGIKSTVNMLIDEFSVLAIPYFFSGTSAVSDNLGYIWSMNGKTIENQTPKNSFTTRLEKAGAGTASIGLKINNTARIFQFIDNGFTINFSKQ